MLISAKDWCRNSNPKGITARWNNPLVLAKTLLQVHEVLIKQRNSAMGNVFVFNFKSEGGGVVGGGSYQTLSWTVAEREYGVSHTWPHTHTHNWAFFSLASGDYYVDYRIRTTPPPPPPPPLLPSPAHTHITTTTAPPPALLHLLPGSCNSVPSSRPEHDIGILRFEERLPVSSRPFHNSRLITSAECVPAGTERCLMGNLKTWWTFRSCWYVRRHVVS